MAVHKLPNFKIDKENPENGIKDLIRIVKPSWKLDNINIQIMSGGYSSKIFRCFENDNEDKITVRIRNMMDDFLDWQSDMEIMAIEHLSSLGHFPTVHAVFANGYCYQYILGKPVFNLTERTGYLDNEILQAIAKEMAFIHSVQLPDKEYKQYLFCQKSKSMILNLPYQSKYEAAPLKESLLKEFDVVDKYITALNMPLTLSHGDSHPGNMVWNESEKKITFVDWELADTGYRYCDIAYLIFFIEMIDPLVCPAMKMTAPEDYQNMYLKFYFDAWCKLMNEKVNAKAFDNFVNTVRKFALIPMLAFLTFSVFFVDLYAEFGGPGNKLDEKLVNDYLKLKKELLGSGKFEE